MPADVAITARVQRYARIICRAQGQDPDMTWPLRPIQGASVAPQRMWKTHVQAALAILKEADADIKRDGAIK